MFGICVRSNCKNGPILSVAACLGFVNSFFNGVSSIKAWDMCIYGVGVFTTEPKNTICIIATNFIKGDASIMSMWPDRDCDEETDFGSSFPLDPIFFLYLFPFGQSIQQPRTAQRFRKKSDGKIGEFSRVRIVFPLY